MGRLERKKEISTTVFKFLTTILAFSFLSCGKSDLSKLDFVKKLEHYPSASGIEFFNSRYYIIGDDANSLLVLDSNLNIIDSITLYHFPGNRIPKEIKPDHESITLIRDKKQASLLLMGSGSLAPRNSGWLIQPRTGDKDSIRFDTLFERFRSNGLEEINIEGSCFIPGNIILSNRGHKAWPKNHLVFLQNGFWKNQTQTPLTIIRIGANSDTSQFSGISGLAYAPRGDRLIMTASTEDTRSTFEDGAIGKSYLWIVDDITSKRRWKGINPNAIIDLEAIDPRFKNQKIESVCVVNETKEFLRLALVADNDDGSSTIFKITLDKLHFKKE